MKDHLSHHYKDQPILKIFQDHRWTVILEIPPFLRVSVYHLKNFSGIYFFHLFCHHPLCCYHPLYCYLIDIRIKIKNRNNRNKIINRRDDINRDKMINRDDNPKNLPKPQKTYRNPKKGSSTNLWRTCSNIFQYQYIEKKKDSSSWQRTSKK